MSLLPFPADIIIIIGDMLYHDIKGKFRYAETRKYKFVVRLCLSSKAMNDVVQTETNRRLDSVLVKLDVAQVKFARGLPPRGQYRSLLPSPYCLQQHLRDIRNDYKLVVYRRHVAKIAARGGDIDTARSLGISIGRHMEERYARGVDSNSQDLPISTPILVLRLHPHEQGRVSGYVSIVGYSFANGMICEGATYLTLPHDYTFTPEQKGYIHALFGRYFTTTIAELKDALARDDANGGAKAREEYNNAPEQDLV